MRWAWGVMLMVGCAHDPAEPLQTPRPKEHPPDTDPSAIHVSDDPKLSPLAKSLAEIEMFALGGVGFAGTRSEGEKLARALATEPDAIEMLERLLVQRNRPARLYAYWLLRTLDPSRASGVRGMLSTDETAVETMSGCSMFKARTSWLVVQIDRMPDRPL